MKLKFIQPCVVAIALNFATTLPTTQAQEVIIPVTGYIEGETSTSSEGAPNGNPSDEGAGTGDDTGSDDDNKTGEDIKADTLPQTNEGATSMSLGALLAMLGIALGFKRKKATK